MKCGKKERLPSNSSPAVSALGLMGKAHIKVSYILHKTLTGEETLVPYSENSGKHMQWAPLCSVPQTTK